MEKVYLYFPLSASVHPGNPRSLILSVVIYLVACAVMRILHTILGWIPIVGWLLRLVFSLVGLYCVAGIILSILKFYRY